MKPVEQTLLDQMHIDDIELQHRKDLLEFADDDADLLGRCRPFIGAPLDNIVAIFYEKLTSHEENALLIGDKDSLAHLKKGMKGYIRDLFSGLYDLDYVNRRLRIGLVHKRIGVSPKLYLAAMKSLKDLLREMICENISDNQQCEITLNALDKLFHFDIQLVIDTYIRSLTLEVEMTRDKVASYARRLEDKVAARTRELEELSRRDGLTDLYNKRALMQFLERDLALAERSRSPLSLVYMDINDFKIINDTRGHRAGDEVLKAVGAALLTVSRMTDVPCRYGGDEFCVILNNSDRQQADRYRRRLEEELRRQRPDISLSFGTATTGPDEFCEAETLIDHADGAMYQDKRKKSSLIVSHSDSPPGSE